MILHVILYIKSNLLHYVNIFLFLLANYIRNRYKCMREYSLYEQMIEMYV